MTIDRSDILLPLFAPTSTLPGIGKRLEYILDNKIGKRVLDLLFHMPISTIDRSISKDISNVNKNSLLTIEITISDHFPSFYKSNKPYKVLSHFENESIEIIFFNARSDYIKKLLPVGKKFIVSGKTDFYKNKIQIINPDYIVNSESKNILLKLEPVYPLFSNINSKSILKAISHSLELIPKNLPEWIPKKVLDNENFTTFYNSLKSIHHPEHKDDILPSSIYRKRLSYDEIFANQIEFFFNKFNNKFIKEFPKNFKLISSKKLISNLDFELTSDQLKVINEIKKDQLSSSIMKRMLQGDVGSGKTIVAITSLLNSFDFKGQSALMAPTEILAKQHFKTISKFLSKFKITIELLTSKIENKIKLDVYKRLENGDIHIIIGTQSLLSKTVVFKSLKLVIIDEQHKFGVKQRNDLQSKGSGVDILMLSATPIPRSLSMTKYADLDISSIYQKPANRIPINTIAVPYNRIEEIINAIERALKAGEKVYWICPVIESTENEDIQAVEKRFKELLLRFSFFNPNMIHGKLNNDLKNQTMESFILGNSKLLISTSVIEVGVDIPDATIIVIENSERFGLAQLHQLRGRVGRGNKNSYCLLIYNNNLNDVAKQRLETIRDTNNGFLIAEKDLKLRGPGEIFGKRQSGDIDFKIASLNENEDYIISINNNIKNFKFNNIKILLNLFNKGFVINTYIKNKFNII